MRHVPDRSSTLEEKIKERESLWSSFFSKWNDLGARPSNDIIPIGKIGRHASFRKRKLNSARGKKCIKKSKFGGTSKYKKLKRRKLLGVKINDEKLVKNIKEVVVKEEISFSPVDVHNHVSTRSHKEFTVDINEQPNPGDDLLSSNKECTVDISEKLNSSNIDLPHCTVKSELNHEGNKYEQDDLSPVLKKPRQHAHCVRKVKIGIGDEDVDTPVKSNQGKNTGFNSVFPVFNIVKSLAEQLMCMKPVLYDDVPAQVSEPKRYKPSEPKGHTYKQKSYSPLLEDQESVSYRRKPWPFIIVESDSDSEDF